MRSGAEHNQQESTIATILKLLYILGFPLRIKKKYLSGSDGHKRLTFFYTQSTILPTNAHHAQQSALSIQTPTLTIKTVLRGFTGQI